jgi:hypothetical protein
MRKLGENIGKKNKNQKWKEYLKTILSIRERIRNVEFIIKREASKQTQHFQ